jgi:hypothetical protein
MFDYWGHSSGTTWVMPTSWTPIYADGDGPKWVVVNTAFRRGGYPYCNFPASSEAGYAH